MLIKHPNEKRDVFFSIFEKTFMPENDEKNYTTIISSDYNL
jgi:hypothetical protein